MKLVIVILFLVCSLCDAQVNYYDHIQPIIQSHCISCHAEGKIGPMALDSYENVSAFAGMIKFVTDANIMPPWRASQDKIVLSVSKYLSSEEKRAIKTWIDEGLIEGKEDSIASIRNSRDTILSLSTDMEVIDSLDYKTAVLKVDQPFTHEGDYKMHQRVFVIPTNLDKDVYVSKVEFISSNSKIVLGCDVSVDTTSLGRKYDFMDPRSGYANVIGVGFRPTIMNWYSWSPDDVQISFDGFKVLPANSDLLLYVMYAPSAKRQLDQSQIILTYSDVPSSELEIISEVLIDSSSLSRPFFIAKNGVQNVRAEYVFMEDVEIYAIKPHGQLICESWEILLVDQNGNSKILLEVNDWQFKWQRKFRFTHPVEVKKGSRIIAKARYNNTSENIDIPILPTKDVQYGEGLSQELFLISFDYTQIK